MIGNFFFSNSGAAAYEIEQSLRFEASSSSRLTRTPSSSGNMRTWTLSMWVKKWNTNIDGKYLWAAGVWSSGNPNTGQYWTGPNRLASTHGVNGVNNAGGSTNPGRLFRDPSAWFHLVVRMDTANATVSNRHRIYINGELIATASSVTQNFEGGWNRNVNHAIGGNNNHGTYSDVYIAEVHNVDGQSLDPTSFGEFNNGVWRPIAYSGSYGTNGFYLKMDPSATNGVGHDHSGNGNHFTASGISTSTSTYNIANDVVKDTPTNNHATWLPGKSSSFLPGQAQAYPEYRNNGNLYGNTGRNSPQAMFASIPFPDNAKTYVEVYINDVGGGGGSMSPGVAITCDLNGFGPYIYGSGNYNIDTAAYFSGYDGAFTWNGGSGTSNGGGYGSSTLIGVAVDTTTTSPTITFYKNGTQAGSGTVGSAYRKNLVVQVSGSTGSSTAVGAYINSGQYDFDNLPSGYSALCTASIPAPDIADGSDYFDTFLYNGTNSSSASDKTGDFTWTPDFVWIKNRNGANSHRLVDVVRGTGKSLISNSTGTEVNSTTYAPTAFISGGFTTETSDNSINGTTSDTYVAWNWLAGGSGSSNTDGSITSTVSANPTAGFSIVSWSATLDATSANSVTIGHGLGVAPDMIIQRPRDTSSTWQVYHSALGTGNLLMLNNTNAKQTASGCYPSVTSTVWTPGDQNYSGGGSHDYINYCFAEVEGYSKFGKYTGNGSSDGIFIYLGFRPAWFMLKAYSDAGEWLIIDSTRDTYNNTEAVLEAHDPTSEAGAEDADMDFLSNGIKFRNTGYYNTGGRSFIYMAFAENPFGGEGVSPVTAR